MKITSFRVAGKPRCGGINSIRVFQAKPVSVDRARFGQQLRTNVHLMKTVKATGHNERWYELAQSHMRYDAPCPPSLTRRRKTPCTPEPRMSGRYTHGCAGFVAVERRCANSKLGVFRAELVVSSQTSLKPDNRCLRNLPEPSGE